MLQLYSNIPPLLFIILALANYLFFFFNWYLLKAILNTGLEDQHLLAQTGGENKTEFCIKNMLYQ